MSLLLAWGVLEQTLYKIYLLHINIISSSEIGNNQI